MTDDEEVKNLETKLFYANLTNREMNETINSLVRELERERDDRRRITAGLWLKIAELNGGDTGRAFKLTHICEQCRAILTQGDIDEGRGSATSTINGTRYRSGTVYLCECCDKAAKKTDD